jgi:hypothetical protein
MSSFTTELYFQWCRSGSESALFWEAGSGSASEKRQNSLKVEFQELWRPVDAHNRWGHRLEGWSNTADYTACPGLGLLSCEHLAIPGAAAGSLLSNVHKQPTWWKSHMACRIIHLTTHTTSLLTMVESWRVCRPSSDCRFAKWCGSATLYFSLYFPNQRPQMVFSVAPIQSQLSLFWPNLEHLCILLEIFATVSAEFWTEAVESAGWYVSPVTHIWFGK